MTIQQKTTPLKQGKQETINFHDNHSIYPFRVMEHVFYENDDEEIKEFKIVLGNSIVSEMTFESAERAFAYIESKPYELLINLICDIYQKFKKDEINTEH